MDWEADFEKKVYNLVRRFRAEVDAHGDGDELVDNPSITIIDGVVTVELFQSKPKKRKRKTKVDDATDSGDELNGDD